MEQQQTVYKTQIVNAAKDASEDDKTLRYLGAADKLKELEGKILESIIENFRDGKYNEVYRQQKELANLRAFVVYEYGKEMPEADKKTLKTTLNNSKNWRKHVAVFADETERNSLQAGEWIVLEKQLKNLETARKAANNLKEQPEESTEKTRKDLEKIIRTTKESEKKRTKKSPSAVGTLSQIPDQDSGSFGLSSSSQSTLAPPGTAAAAAAAGEDPDDDSGIRKTLDPPKKRKIEDEEVAYDSSTSSSTARSADLPEKKAPSEDMDVTSSDQDLSSSIALVQLNSDDEEDLGEWIPSSGADKEE